jgi:HD-like signal output (HDOD) protein
MGLFTTSSRTSPASTDKDLPPVIQQGMSRVAEIASLPEVAAQICAVVEDPRATPKDIHTIVERDPALATKILKIVNSAFYGLPAQVSSLERAILMLGLNALKNLALATSLSKLIKPGAISTQFVTQDLWRHAIAVGVCAKMIAKAAKYPVTDEAFVAGLVHDMGLIVSQQLHADKMHEICERCFQTPQDFCAVERAAIGADHQQFGHALATRWKFPPGIRAAVGYHHAPTSLQPEHQRIATIVHLADTLCCGTKYGFWLTGFTQDPPDTMLDIAGLTTPAIEEIIALLPQRIEEAEAAFSG